MKRKFYKMLRAAIFAPMLVGVFANAQSDLEEENFRPYFHFTPKTNWMNDPNGLFYADGKYHLYFQHYPDGNTWGPMHWGHATSEDLITWTEHPIAIFPDENGWIFSGSAVKDIKNTSGLGTTSNPAVVALYTIHSQPKEKQGLIDVETQGLAFSNDNGFTWKKYDGNPVIDNPGIRDFRDPKVVWDEIHQQWLMVLAAQDHSRFYSSKDLKNWNFLSEFGKGIGAHGGVWECPDFFPMKVSGSNQTKWVLLQSLNPGGPNGGSGTQYFVGDFDGTTFTLDPHFAKSVSEQNGIWLDYGNDNYAGVTWSNNKAGDDRKLLIGWMSNWDYAQVVPTHKWRSAMTLPRELRLVKSGNDYRIWSAPIAALQSHVGKTVSKKPITVRGEKTISKGEIDFSKAELRFSVTGLKANQVSFSLSNSKGEKISFGIDSEKNELFFDRSQSGQVSFSDKFASPVTIIPLEKGANTAEFQIVLDKTSIEIFLNGGEKAITEIYFPNEPFTELQVKSKNKVRLHNITLNQLNF